MNSTLRRWMVPAFLIALTFAFAACSDDDGITNNVSEDISGTESLDTMDLNEEYGGLAFTDEDEAFGDAELMAVAMSEEAGLAEDDEDSLCDRDPQLRDRRMERIHLRILWGQLEGRFDPATDATEPQRLDWSGTASVTSGAIFLKRTILFEKPFDHRLPRDSRLSLGWVSHTGPHFDGVALTIAVPVQMGPADSTGGDLPEPQPEPEFTFATGPYTVTYKLSELDGLDEVVVVDDLGNAVSIQARKFDPEACAEGFLTGFWKSTPDNPETAATEMGLYRGIYVSEDGHLHGFLMGRYGLTTDGERVFIGKFVGRYGRVRGLMRGTWTPDGDAAVMGSFAGRWVGRTGEHLGSLEGRYVENGEDERGDGFFRGRWQEACTTPSMP